MLITSITSIASTTEAAPRAAYVDRGLDSPTVTPWPEGLPQARILPDNSICLPQELAQQVVGRLQALDDFPIACQGVIQANRKHAAETHEIAIGACKTRCRASIAEAAAASSEGWRWYEVALAVVGGAGGGLLVGFIAATLGGT